MPQSGDGALESCGVPRKEFCKWVLLAPQLRALAKLLWPEIRARHPARPLLDFFTTARENGWYCNLGYPIGTDDSNPVRTSTLPTPLGAVTLELQRKEVERPAAVVATNPAINLRGSAALATNQHLAADETGQLGTLAVCLSVVG
jgi:hypothetical protein